MLRLLEWLRVPDDQAELISYDESRVDGAATVAARVLYFAYGSNLLTARLIERAPSARFVGIGRLSGHELRLHKRGRDGTAKADAFATAHPARPLWGALARLTRRDLSCLDDIEGSGYRRITVDVDTGHGTTEAETYRAVPSAVDDGLAPAAWYLGMIIAGGAERGLPDAHLTWLAGHRTASSPDSSMRSTP